MPHQNEHNPSYYICKQMSAPFAVRKSFQKVTSHFKQAAWFSSSDQIMNRTLTFSSSCLRQFSLLKNVVNQVKCRKFSTCIQKCKYSFSQNNSMLSVKMRIWTVTCIRHIHTHTHSLTHPSVSGSVRNMKTVPESATIHHNTCFI